MDQQRPDGARPLFVVKRVFAGRYFAPPGNPVRHRLYQNDVALVGTTKAGLEKMHQRHADVPQDQPL
jgi:hypothetical protein